MASGYLIRDCEGRIAGYAMLKEGKLLLCVNRGAKSMTSVVVAGREEKTMDVPCDGCEHAYEWNAGSIERVFLGRHETVSYDEERPVIDDERQAAPAKEKKDCRIDAEGCKKDVSSCVYKEERDAGHRERMLRWPPPPCIGNARYVDGRWEED